MQNRHHDLTPTARITSNMTREAHHIRHDYRLALLRRSSAHTTSELDRLARGPTLEWA